MKLLKEFKEFAYRGNVMDLAVGVVLGTAFGKIVSSLVADIIMPVLGLILSDVDFKKLVIVLRQAEIENGVVIREAINLNIGNFIQTIFDFVLIAFAIFFTLKAISSFRKKEEAKEEQQPKTTRQEQLLEDIRDILKKKS